MKQSKIYIGLFLILAITAFVSSCTKSEFEPYDHPFFHIHVDNADSISVRYNRRDTVNYMVYLSAKTQFEPIDVTYELIPGNGLTEGVDYKLITPTKTLNFPAGIFQKSIRIAWFERVLDPTKNNTLTIKLINNTKNFTLGLPGPDHRQQQLKILKY